MSTALPLFFAGPFLRARAAATLRWVAMTARFIRACRLAPIRIQAPPDPWSNQLARQPTVRSRPAVLGAHQPRPGARHWRRRSLRDAGVPAPQRPHPGNARTGTHGAGCACRCFGPGRTSTHCSVERVRRSRARLRYFERLPRLRPRCMPNCSRALRRPSGQSGSSPRGVSNEVFCFPKQKGTLSYCRRSCGRRLPDGRNRPGDWTLRSLWHPLGPLARARILRAPVANPRGPG